MLGLYVHVPFCAAICNYCNFNRGLFDEPLKNRYMAALREEMRRSVRLDPADSLYFGGGTPSLLSPAEIGTIIETARDLFALTRDAEITLEANPETIDTPRLDGFRAAGVNRLSFGVQSFRDEELVGLDRLHTADRAADAVRSARDAGFDNVSIDLMMWLPRQTAREWMVSVERAIAIAPEHVSLYMLEVYPHLPLGIEMAKRGWTQLPDDVAAEMYEEAMSRFESAGYEQYEISNVAKPRCRSRHNLKYWSDGEWLGFGPGAHSTREGRRWKNVSSTDDYISRIDRGAAVIAEERTMTQDERLGDALFTGLRLNDGIELTVLSAQYETDIWQRYGERLAPYLEAGLLMKEGSRVRLSRQGMLLAHEVMSVFV